VTAREFKHRREKRIREVRIAMDVLRPLLLGKGRLSVLEFGSGSGVQADELCKLGDVVASDIDCSGFGSQKGVDCVECNISSTPFESQKFDLVYSNHVVEHLDNAAAAYAEMRRLGKDGCVYAFSVPTNLWLVLTIPAQLWSKLRAVAAVLSGGGYKLISGVNATGSDRMQNVSSPRARSYRILKGHGVEARFLRCYESFKVEQWRRTFEGHGFKVVSVNPLLLYGPSEFPLLPTMAPLFGRYASSVLFVLK
jgi:SAM-dependent methyltransferase